VPTCGGRRTASQKDAPVWVTKHLCHEPHKRMHIRNLNQTTGIPKQSDVLAEIARVWPNGDGTAQPRRLQRVLAATGRKQTPADERNRREPIPQTELPNGIDDPDSLANRRLLPGRSPRRTQLLGQRGASIGMPRRNDGQ
jgi:hypothetical protein